MRPLRTGMLREGPCARHGKAKTELVLNTHRQTHTHTETDTHTHTETFTY